MLEIRIKAISSFDSSTTITSVMFANLLAIGEDVDPTNGSPIVTRLISEAVIESFVINYLMKHTVQKNLILSVLNCIT